MNVDDYVSVLKRQLPKYKQIKLPTVDEETAKKILAKLIAQGMTVEFKDGYFVLKESKNTQTAQSDVSKTSQEGQQQPATPTGTTAQTTQDVAREGNTIVLGNTVRVCVRLRQGLVDALHAIYNEPSTSNAIRKAVLEVIQSRGYKIVSKQEDDAIDVDEILGGTNE